MKLPHWFSLGLVAVLSACSAAPGEDETLVDSTSAALIAGDYDSVVTTTIRSSLSASEGNLSSGTTDWAHFTSPTVVDGGAFDGIKNFTRIGTGPYAQIPVGPLAFSWTGGSPTNSASDVRSHVRTCGTGSGFSFDIPRTTRVRRLRVFVGAHNAAADFVLWRGNVGRSTGTLVQSASGSQFGYYDVTTSSSSSGTQRAELRIKQAGSTAITLNSCVSLLAATLVDVPDTAGTVAVKVVSPFPREGQSMTVQVDASHSSGVRGVELFYDNVKVGESRTPPYQFNPWVKPGVGKLHAEVTTLIGTTFKSTAINVTGWYRLDNAQTTTIPDAGDWVELPMKIGTSATGKTVKEAMVMLFVAHPYVGDLELKLLSPNDKSVMLSANNGGGGDNYWGTIFFDQGQPLSVGAPPFDNYFQPQEPLSGMVGQPYIGSKPWRVSVRDDYANDVGTVNQIGMWLRLD